MMKMYQCKLSKTENCKKVILVGYIEERAAKLNALVEVKDQEGLWLVESVDDNPISVEQVRNKQKADRNSLKSITS